MLIKVFGTAVDVDRIVYVEFATNDNATCISLGGPDCVWIKGHTVDEVLAEISKRVPAVSGVTYEDVKVWTEKDSRVSGETCQDDEKDCTCNNASDYCLRHGKVFNDEKR